jgi:coenzyme F420-reducing hydrogenase delta subunit
MTLQIYLFCCLSNFDPAELGEMGGEFRTIPLPCSGKADILYLTKAFETGADGVAVLTCPEGECRYLEGNLRARKRRPDSGAGVPWSSSSMTPARPKP